MKLLIRTFILFVFSLAILSVLITPKTIRAAEGDVKLQECSASVSMQPYTYKCISDIEYEKRSPNFPAGLRGDTVKKSWCPVKSKCVNVGYGCGYNPGSFSGIQCIETNAPLEVPPSDSTKELTCDNPGLNSPNVCNNSPSCFWYMGNPIDGTSRARCVSKNGDKLNPCGAGFCYGNQTYCPTDSLGSYCSATPGPPASQSQSCSELDSSLNSDKGQYATCLTSCNSAGGETPQYSYTCPHDDVTGVSLVCCQGNGTTTGNKKDGNGNLCNLFYSNVGNSYSASQCSTSKPSSSGNWVRIPSNSPDDCPSGQVCWANKKDINSGDNSCLTYDPPYTPAQTAEVFSCDTSSNPCSGPNQAKYTSTSYNKCANGGVCCYNTEKYGARKIQSNGSGNNPPPASTTTAPGQESPAPSSDRCTAEGKGNLDTAFSKPDGYWGATCGGKFIGETNPATAVKGRQYADRYKCTKTGADGTNYVDVKFSSPTDPNNPCDQVPWIDTSVTPVCKAGVGGAVVDCAKVNGPNYTCTFDYNSSGTQNKDTLTHCCPDNKRYCDVAGTCVDAGQGCYGKLSLQSVCVKGNDTDCSDYAAGARCLDPDGDTIFHCLYPPGTPTPTPTAGVAKNCTVGQKGTGCACDSQTSCGCASTHNPEPSLDDPTKYYCMPFPSTGMKWCSVTKSAMPANTDPAVCKGSTPYSTPTPISKGCPNDGNHLCVPTNYCQAGFGPSNDSTANTACAGWNPDTPQCYTRGNTPLSTCTATPPVVTSTPGTTTTPVPTKGPAATGCPIDNGDGRVNSCQQTCNGSYPNARPVGNADCVAAYGTIRGACCTSN